MTATRVSDEAGTYAREDVLMAEPNGADDR